MRNWDGKLWWGATGCVKTWRTLPVRVCPSTTSSCSQLEWVECMNVSQPFPHWHEESQSTLSSLGGFAYSFFNLANVEDTIDDFSVRGVGVMCCIISFRSLAIGRVEVTTISWWCKHKRTMFWRHTQWHFKVSKCYIALVDIFVCVHSCTKLHPLLQGAGCRLGRRWQPKS